MKPRVFVVGHSHIDAVWLWDRKETLDICRKTFSQVLEIIKKYPWFIYSQSTAQYYEWMEKEFPELFKEIKEKIENGAIEPVGGMWVESDCNLPSSESLARQILYAKRYFLEKFNKEVRVAWLPDTFGFCRTLPQIFKKSGIDYFLTSKLVWQSFHPFPHYAFWWKSPDGTKILGIQTVGLYSNDNPAGINHQLGVIRNTHGIETLIFLFGNGDHGEGLVPDMVGNLEKFIGENPGLEIKCSSAEGYFEALSQEVKEKDIPLVDDELYLKTHQGTFTTFSEIKENNRLAEVLLDCIERFSVISGVPYPKKELDEFWKTLLFNQFHDSLAGTSIPKVYDDSRADFKDIFNKGKKLLNAALEKIPACAGNPAEGKPFAVFNPISWKRTGPAAIEAKDASGIVDSSGKSVLSQKIKEGGKEKLLFMAKDVPSLGYSGYRKISAAPKNKARPSLWAGTCCIQNKYFHVCVDSSSGRITKILNRKGGRNTLSGRGIALQVFEDNFPGEQETAWNIHLGRMNEMKIAGKLRVTEKGPVRASIEADYVFREKGSPDSKATMRISVYDSLPLVEFDLSLDWHSKYKMLKVAFPFFARNDRTAFEIPFGCTERLDPDAPQATVEQRHRKEVPGQRWVDHTDTSGKFGACLVNNNRYGFDAKNNVVRMSALRTPSYPGYNPWNPAGIIKANSDLGTHRISFALYPHKGGWREINAPRLGYEFNYPLMPVVVSARKGTQPAYSFAGINKENIIMSALKKAEDGNGLVLRFYETMGRKTTVEIKFSAPVKSASETDMIERDLRTLRVKGNSVKLSFNPYEIKTIKITVLNI